MCDGTCGDGLPKQIGRPQKKKNAIGQHGYADGKGFAGDLEGNLKEHGWDATKRGLGATTGFVIASAVVENVEVAKDNTIVSMIGTTVVGVVAKQMMPISFANGYLDNVANGVITYGGVQCFKALAKGFAAKWGIRGIQKFAPQMQFKRSS